MKNADRRDAELHAVPVARRTESGQEEGRSSVDRVRVIGFFAHVDAGKTTTSEGLLYHTGRIHRMGRVDQGSTQLDWMEQERQRGITITSAATTLAWKAHRINLIDTPGHVDFSAEVVRSMRVIDGAVIVLCAVGGVEPQTETVWRYADQEGLPRLIFVNKLDREGADFTSVLAEIQARLTASAVALQIPVGSERGFSGVIDLLDRRALVWSAGAPEPVAEAVPPPLDAQVCAARETLVEAICATDEALLAQWLDGCEPERAALQAALRRATIAGELVPVICGSALHDIGLQPLLEAVVECLPSPFEKPRSPVIDTKDGPDAPLCAAVFKIVTDPYLGHLTWVRVFTGHLQTGEWVRNSRTGLRERVGRIFRMHADKREQLDRMTAGDVVALGGTKSAATGDTLCDPEHPVELERLAFPEPVIRVALAPGDERELDRLHRAVVRLAEEDPTLISGHDSQTGEDTLSGMGELHLEIAVDRLRTEFGVVPQVSKPQIAYRETVQRRAESTATYRRQSGGHGHYAQVQLRVEPLPYDRGVVFANVAQAPGGPSDRGRGHRSGVPAEYVRHIELGVREVLGRGIFAGYPGTSLQVTLLDGRFHSVDTCGMDFRIAGSMAVRQAVCHAGPALLEPVMRLDLDMDEEHFGAVAADLVRRRGRIKKVDTRGGGQHLVAEVPLSTMRGYASDLRSLTQGRCTFVLKFQQYEQVPEEETRAIVAQRRLEGKIPQR